MDTPITYSDVPRGYGLCMAENCPMAATCLRQIAYKLLPEDTSIHPIFNPKTAIKIVDRCKQYKPVVKIRYAYGFMCIFKDITVRNEANFRCRMISHFGKKSYYMRRKGLQRILPDEQKYIIQYAKSIGIVLDEYFDSYQEAYAW